MENKVAAESVVAAGNAIFNRRGIGRLGEQAYRICLVSRPAPTTAVNLLTQ
ncbi:hypothetical protein [Saccharopolyspora sp. NPDC002376]